MTEPFCSVSVLLAPEMQFLAMPSPLFPWIITFAVFFTLVIGAMGVLHRWWPEASIETTAKALRMLILSMPSK